MERNHNLEKLLKEKSFAELSAEEQSWVLQFYSEKQYTEYRRIINSSSLILSEAPTLSSSVKTQVMATLPKATPFFRRSSIKRLAMAASWLLFIAIGFLLGRQNIETSSVIVYHDRVDTIYLEQQILLAKNTTTNIPQEENFQQLSEHPKTVSIKKTVAAYTETSINPLIRQNELENIALQDIIPVTELPEPFKAKNSINSDDQLLDLILEVY